MSTSKKNRLLKMYIFISIYSNAFRVILGKWGTLLADLVLIIILSDIIFIQNKGSIYYTKKIRWVVIPILLLQFLSIIEIFNSNINNTLYGLIEYRKSIFQLICFFLAYYCSDNEKKWENIEFVEWVTAPTILYGIKQNFFYSNFDSIFYKLQDAASDTLQYGGTRRVISIYSGPFHFGMICSLMLCIAIALLLITKKKRHILNIILCLVGAYCSLTRTNLVCCIAVIGIFVFCKLTEQNTVQSFLRKLIVVVLALLVFIWFAKEYTTLINDNNSIAMLINSVLNFGSDNRFSGRIDTWGTALNMIIQHPIIGYGMGSAGDTLAKRSIALRSVTPHNMFIKMFVETGIVGVILLIVILISSWKLCVKTTEGVERSFYIACFAVVLLNALVGSTISTFPIMSLFWIFIGMNCSKYNRRIK